MENEETINKWRQKYTDLMKRLPAACKVHGYQGTAFSWISNLLFSTFINILGKVYPKKLSAGGSSTMSNASTLQDNPHQSTELNNNGIGLYCIYYIHSTSQYKSAKICDVCICVC